MKIDLPYRRPFDFSSLLFFYRMHQMGNLESFTPNSMVRVFEDAGRFATVTMTDDPERSCLVAEVNLKRLVHREALEKRVRALFDLDIDPRRITKILGRDREILKLARKYPGLRLPTGWDSFELSIATILGQLVSVDRARALLADLIGELGEEIDLRLNGQAVSLFPTPEVLARADYTFLKTTGMRKKTLATFAKAVADGRVHFNPDQDAEAFIENLIELPGIGPWTATYIAMKALRHADAFPGSDLILARALEIHPPDVVEKMRPWRGYAAALLWREYAGTLQKKRANKDSNIKSKK